MARRDIIVLEGVNGVGKSTYAAHLSRLTNMPVIRAFSRKDVHGAVLGDGSNLANELRRLRVPYNTYVDDLYVADILRQAGSSAILDRSMVSAVVYPLVYGEDRMHGFIDDGKVTPLLRLWHSLLCVGDVRPTYVWLESSYAIAKSRREGDSNFPGKKTYNHLNDLFYKLFLLHNFSGWQKIRFPQTSAQLNTECLESYPQQRGDNADCGRNKTLARR